MRVTSIHLTDYRDGAESGFELRGLATPDAAPKRDAPNDWLWYRFPAAYAPAVRGDAFLAACLMPAMKLGEPLEIDESAPVSPKLLANMGWLQEIYMTWYPDLKKIPIVARTEVAPTPAEDASVCFFTGGVDSMFTFLKHRERLTHLLFCKGIDMQLSNSELLEETIAVNKRFADEVGKQFIVCSSNVRFFGHAYGLSWKLTDSVGLASIGLSLGIPHVYLAAGRTYAQVAVGMRAMTDHFMSTDTVEFFYDGGEASRIEKLAIVAENERSREILRVCWQDAGYNCGECEKCLVTMAAVRALGVSFPRLPALGFEQLQVIRKLPLHDELDVFYYRENLAQAEKTGDLELARAIRQALLKRELRNSLIKLDRLMSGGGLRRGFARLLSAKTK